MSNTEVTIDTEDVRRMFAELQSKDRKKVFKKTIRDGLNVIKKAAVSNLRQCINPHMLNHKDRWNNSFKKGIKTKVYKDNQSGVIHILGNFKLRFFELGTRERRNKKRNGQNLKKRRNTGSIPAYHFFKNARRSKEREVLRNMDTIITQSIIKINNKYKR